MNKVFTIIPIAELEKMKLRILGPTSHLAPFCNALLSHWFLLHMQTPDAVFMLDSTCQIHRHLMTFMRS